jgi:hypothetical protein
MSDLSPPFPEIYQGLRAGTVVPFLGSGASLPATLGRWKVDGPDRFPMADELAQALAHQVSYPEEAPMELSLVAQYFDGTNGRQSLKSFLRQVFDHPLPCAPLHHLLARTMSHGVLITTNYDDLLERAFADRAYDLVVHSVDADSRALDRVLLRRAGSDDVAEYTPKTLPVDGSQRPLIYKMHGSVDRSMGGRDRFLITEDDYVDFLTRMTRDRAVPAQVMAVLRQCRMLFLGYGLRDWNLRVVLNSLSRKRDARQPGGALPRSWAIQYDVSAVDRNAWQDRNVLLYQMSLQEFVDRLEELEPSHPYAADEGGS